MILGEASDPDRAYIEQIMPDKIRYNMKYICNRSVKEYFKIIFLTYINPHTYEPQDEALPDSYLLSVR